MNNLSESAAVVVKNTALQVFRLLPHQIKTKLFDAYGSLLKKVNGIYLKDVASLMRIIIKNGGLHGKNSTTSTQREKVVKAQLKMLKINTKAKAVSEKLIKLTQLKSKYCGLQST